VERALVHRGRGARRARPRGGGARLPTDVPRRRPSVAPPVFALLVESTSWGVAFALAATLPLAGAGLVRRIPA
jgi:hypothetical protein